MTNRLLIAAALVAKAACDADLHTGGGSVRIDADTHVAGRSAGCGKGKGSPYKLGKTTVAKGTYAGVQWTYRVYMPKGYDSNKPMPLIIQHPGWGMTAKSEEAGCGIGLYADKLGFISVTVQGGNDNSNPGGPWYSWNAAGTSHWTGPAGPTCVSQGSHADYCYKSCQPCGALQCAWATCEETGPTPSGTGRKNIGGFTPGLFDTLEDQLCIDTTREYAAGESNGGIMTYQLGVDLGHRLAAIAPQYGTFPIGFNLAPLTGVPVIDIHGFHDTTLPANVSLAGNGYLYTITAEIFGGNKYSSGWKASNNCSGPISHYPTKFDGIKELYCVSEGSCSGGDVVRCAWNGGHNWFANSAKDNGGLVTDWLTRWAKKSHIGKGYIEGEQIGPGNPLENIVILGEEDPSVEGSFDYLEQTLVPTVGGHYGDPANGCRDDEDVIRAGTGSVCSPRIGTSADTLPVPNCKLGGVSPFDNGCPVDAPADQSSRAWPICLGKGNTTDPYTNGEFHCMLVCPCASGGDECGAEADSHCPKGAKCERGELRNMAHGVCTYHDNIKQNAIVV